MPAARPVLYSIGHSRHGLDTFLELLRRHGVEALADVRSRPGSRFSPHFNRSALAAALETAGIEYVFLGAELGGRPENPDLYDTAGNVLYERIAASPAFQAGIERLEAEAARPRVAIMCAEEDPLACHRRFLITRALEHRGAEVRHIRKDGRLETEAELRAREGDPTLFDDAGDGRPGMP